MGGSRTSILKIPIHKSSVLFYFAFCSLTGLYYCHNIFKDLYNMGVRGGNAKTEAKAMLEFSAKNINGHFCLAACVYVEFLSLY